MKSEELIDKFRTCYEEFFKDCNVVVSCPGVFFWAGEHAILRGVPAICQHVPLRTYVGLEPTKLLHSGARSEIILERKSLDYMPEKGAFEERDQTERKELREVRERFIKVIQKICEREEFEQNSFNIHVLNELPPGIGCNWSGAFSAALALALMVLNDRVKEEQITEWQRMRVSELPLDENFDRCNRIAWEIEAIFHGGRVSGYGPFCSLVSTGQPIVYFTVERREDDPRYPPIDLSSNPEMIYERERLKYSGFSFVEKGWVEEDYTWSILFGLISSGTEKSTAQSIDFVREERRKALAEAASKILECIEEEKKMVSGIELEKLPFFNLCYKERDKLGMILQDSSFQALAVQVGEVFGNLKALVTCQKQDEFERYLKRLARSIKGVEGGLSQLGLQWLQGDLISSSLYLKFIECGIWEESAIKLVGGGRGGTLFFITPKESKIDNVSMSEKIIACLQELKKEHPHLLSNLSLYWLSSEGFEREGARLEKPVEKENDRFKATANQSWKVIYCSPQGERISQQLYRAAIEKLKHDHGIIFIDEIEEEVFVGGRIPYDIIRKVVVYYLEHLLLKENPASQTKIEDSLKERGKWSKSWEEAKNVTPHLKGFEKAVLQCYPNSGFRIDIEPSDRVDVYGKKKETRAAIGNVRLKQGSVEIYIRIRV